MRKAYAGGSAGGDHVAGLQRDHLRDVLDQLRNLENELAGVGFLQNLAADFERDIQRVRIGDLILGDDARPHGREGVEGLAHQPLRGGVLVIARADVVDDGVAEDVLHAR